MANDPGSTSATGAGESTQRIGGQSPGETAIMAGPTSPAPLITAPAAAGGRPPGGPGDDRDRLAVHFVWEAILFGLLLLLAGAVVVTELFLPGVRPSMGREARLLLTQFVWVGTLAVALAWSLRAAVPNLAVGCAAVVSGLLFTSYHGIGVVPAAGIALGGVLGMGVVIAVLVLLRTPAWAASFATGIAVTGAVGALVGRRSGDFPQPLAGLGSGAYLWLALGLVVVPSLLAGALCLVGPIRRFVGGARATSNPPERRGAVAGLAAVIAVLGSSLLAAVAGVLYPVYGYSTQAVSSGFYFLLAPFAAVLIGGVSLYGRRGGLFGTLLGVLLVVGVTGTAQAVLRATDVPGAVGTAHIVATGVLIVFGLLVTRLVERFGTPRSPAVLVGVPVAAQAPDSPPDPAGGPHSTGGSDPTGGPDLSGGPYPSGEEGDEPTRQDSTWDSIQPPRRPEADPEGAGEIALERDDPEARPPRQPNG